MWDTRTRSAVDVVWRGEVREKYFVWGAWGLRRVDKESGRRD